MTIVELRINQKIRIASVRVIDETGQQLGVLPTDEARRIAWERGFDLVEVSPNAEPPVCKIMDYGKFKYAEQKKQQHAPKHRVHIKEVRLGPRTEEHDIQVKLNHIRDFVHKGDKVTVTMMFRGREKAHKELGYALMQRIEKEIEEFAQPETPIVKQGSRLFLNLIPKKQIKPVKKIQTEPQPRPNP